MKEVEVIVVMMFLAVLSNKIVVVVAGSIVNTLNNLHIIIL